MTQSLPRRDGRAGRRQIPVLALTAQCLRRRRGSTASVLAECPVQSAPLISSGAPYRLSPTQDVAVVLTTYSESAKAANLRNRPVSSLQIGMMRRLALQGPMVRRNFYIGAPLAAHGGARDSSSNSPRHTSRRAGPFTRSGGQSHSA